MVKETDNYFCNVSRSKHWSFIPLVYCKDACQRGIPAKPTFNPSSGSVFICYNYFMRQMEDPNKSCCLASFVVDFVWSLISLEKIINGLSVNATNIVCVWHTSIKTKRPAKNSNVAHSTRCRMISKSWRSARTKSHSAPRIAIQPER